MQFYFGNTTESHNFKQVSVDLAEKEQQNTLRCFCYNRKNTWAICLIAHLSKSSSKNMLEPEQPDVGK